MGRHSREDYPASGLPDRAGRAAGGPGRLGPPTPLRYGTRGATPPPAPEAEPGYSAFGQAEVGFSLNGHGSGRGGHVPREDGTTFHEPGFGQITFGDGGPAEPASFTATARETGYAPRPEPIGYTPHSTAAEFTDGGVSRPAAPPPAGYGRPGVHDVPFGGPPFGLGDPSPPGAYAQPLPPSGHELSPALQPPPDHRVTDALRRPAPEPPADHRTTVGLPRPPREAPGYPTHGTGSHHVITGSGSYPVVQSTGGHPVAPEARGARSGGYPSVDAPGGRSGSYPAIPAVPGEGRGTRSGSYRAVGDEGRSSASGQFRSVRDGATSTGSRPALTDDSPESRATASGRFRISEERKARSGSTGGHRIPAEDRATSTGSRRAVRDDSTSTGSRRAVREARSGATGSHATASEGKSGSTSTGSRRVVREDSTSTGSRRAVREGGSGATGGHRVASEGLSTASGTHRAIGAAVKRRKIAKWPIFTGVFVVLVVLGLLGWAWAGNVLNSRAEAQANACTDGDSNLTVVVTPSVQPPVAAAAARWNQAKTVVHAHCIHVDVRAMPSQQVLDALTGKTDVATIGGIPAAWVPENSYFVSQLQAAKPGTIGAPPESVATAPSADYPFVGLAGTTVDDVQARAAQVFRDYLRDPAQHADFQQAGLAAG